MTRARIPDEILSAAHARSRARLAKEWVEADRLRAVLEDAGWRVVDRGVDFRLEPAIPPDTVAGGATIHGSSASVLSRLGEPSARPATIVLLADHPADLAAALAGLGDAGRSVAQVVAVAAEAVEVEPREGVEIVRMIQGAALGARLNAGIRRATGAVIVVLDGTAAVRGDILTPLMRALDHPSVAIAGGWGSRTDDLRTFTPVEADAEADVIDLVCLAFRREDAVRIGPLDERLVDAVSLGAWLSLALRYGSAAPAIEDPPTPRGASVVRVPAERAADSRGANAATMDEAARRAARRDFYRLRDAFGPLVAEKRTNRA